MSIRRNRTKECSRTSFLNHTSLVRPLGPVPLVCLFVAAFSIAGADASDVQISELPGRVVAVGIPGAGAVSAVSTFHPGGPICDNPKFHQYTEPGQILEPARILVASSSNFGAPIGMRAHPSGSVLSIDPRGKEPLVIPPVFAAGGGQARALGGRVILFTANSTAFLNSVHNQQAITAQFPAVANPTGISLNNGFGRIWVTSAPLDFSAAGIHSVLDPDGCPLDQAPNKVAGGVFTATSTNRSPQLIEGSMIKGAIATALLGKSPDRGGRAVFAGLHADGSVVQVHVEAGVDGLAPAGTIHPLENTSRAFRAGMVLNWVPDMTLYITDPNDNSVAALELRSVGKTFQVRHTRRIMASVFDLPVDIAPTISESASANFSSNTTVAGGADLYIANRGNDTVVRLRQDGSVIAIRKVTLNGVGLNGGHLNGIAVSPDATHIWITATGSVGSYPDGAVIELPAFGALENGS